MKRSMTWCLIGLSLVFATAQAGRADDEFDALLEYVPRSANTLVMINVEKFLASPMALSEGKKKDMAFRFAEGAIALPSDAKRVVMASQMNFQQMLPQWEISVMEVDELWSMEKVARSARGYVEPLDDLDAVWSPYNSYVAKLGSFRIGTLAPANRQHLSRWVYGERAMALSPYLKHAARFATEVGTEVIVALDLEYVVDPDRLWMRIPRLKCLAGREYNREELHQFLLSVRGATIGVTFSARPFGSLKIDFGRDAYPVAEFAKPLMLELLELSGAGVDGTDDWKAKVTGSTVTLSGYLSESARRRLASIIELRPPTQSPVEEPGASAELSIGEATQQQYKLVDILLRDLRLQAKEPGNFQGLAVWLDKYARRIEDLPMKNIDGEFVKYRLDVAARLGRMAEDIRYGNVPGYSRGVHRTGPNSDATVTEEDSTILAEARAINGATLGMAKALGDRYGLEF